MPRFDFLPAVRSRKKNDQKKPTLNERPIAAKGRVISEKEIERFLNPENIIQVEHKGKACQSKKYESETMKTHQGYFLFREGMDFRTTNEQMGIAVLTDGVSTGRNSQEMARLTTIGMRWLLENIPGNLTPEESVELINQQIKSYLLDLVRTEKNAATMLLATRYLPESDELLIIDIGNCQLILDNGQEIINLKEEEEEEARSLKGDRQFTQDPLMIKQIGEGYPNVVDERPNKRPLAYKIKLSDYRKPGENIRLLMGSDGYMESTGRHLLSIKSLDKIDLSAVYAKDDISLLELEIPKK